jgi:hypothetical protein
MDAVQSFRRKAFDAGNLKSDDKQLVSLRSGVSGAPDVIVIESADPETVHVPIYEASNAIHPGAPYPYSWSAPYPYYYDSWAPYYVGAFYGALIGFGCDWDDDDIYRGDIDREKVKQRIEDRRNSNMAEQIRRNPENRWRADRSGLERARASGGAARAAVQQRTASGATRGADHALSSGAFSGIDRGAAASRFSARGAGSLGAARAGGFRGGGGGRRR